MAPEPYPTDGVDGLGDVAPVNLCQFPAEEPGRAGSGPGTQPGRPAPKWLPAPTPLHFLLMLLPCLGLRDTVVAFPVQDFLQFLLLPGGAGGG